MASTPQKEPRLACLVCRSRKVACDRQRPRCGLCAKNGFDCQYKSRQHRPGLKAGYVSQLERQLEDVQDRLKKIENHLEKSSPTFSGEEVVSTPLHLDQGEPIQVDDSTTISDANEQYTSPGYGGEATPLLGRIMHWQDLASQESLLYPVANICVREWFQKCHSWFPILHQLSVHDISEHTLSRYTLVWKAVTVVVSLNQGDNALIPRDIIGRLEEQVLFQGLATATLESIQALLILCSVFFASGNLAQCWNAIAVCKRSFLHPQMGAYFEDPASMNRPTMPLPRNSTSIDSVEQEEAIRAFWMTEMLDGILTVGLPNQYTHGDPPLSIRLPCMESLWSSGTVPQDQPASPRPQYSSGFSLCIMLAVEELGVVRTFLKKPYELSRLEQRLDWQSEAQRIDERLTNWREEFVANVFQLINYEKEYVPRGEMEPFFTLTNCLLNIALITLLQQMAPLPKEVDIEHEPWSFATTRCVYACENLTAKVRRIEANQLVDESPYLILCVFVAARFYITYSKALDADVPANLHTLAFVLHTCGKKWPLANMCEIIIRTAVAEHRSPISQCVLPIEFYDSRYSTLGIMDLLQDAAKGLDLP